MQGAELVLAVFGLQGRELHHRVLDHRADDRGLVLRLLALLVRDDVGYNLRQFVRGNCLTLGKQQLRQILPEFAS
jgi:hypothetical protein